MKQRKRISIFSGMLALAAFPALVAASPALGSSAPLDDRVAIALLLDLSSGQTLTLREADRRFVPASVTKVMSIYTAFKLVAEGKLHPDSTVTISQEIADEWSGEGSSMFLKAGDEVTIDKLLMGVTTVSANDGAVALGVNATGSLENWLRLMNRNAAALGMRDSNFGSANGFPDEGQTYTTAQDLARLGTALVREHPELYRRYFGKRGMTYNGITQANHDPVSGVVEGADGMKTGFTRQAGYTFLGTAEREGRRLIVVIGAAESDPARDKAARDLLNWGFDAFESRLLLPAEAIVGEALVQEGSAGSVPLLTKRAVRTSIPRGASPGQVDMSLHYRGPLTAPLTKGQEVAELRIEIAGQEPYSVPLIAGADVAKAGFWGRLRNGFAGLFT